MCMAKVEIDIPQEMSEFTVKLSPSMQLLRNAMILYPYIQNCTISNGRAAEILGISKIDLIALYSKIGLDYLDMSDEEFEAEIQTAKELENQ